MEIRESRNFVHCLKEASSKKGNYISLHGKEFSVTVTKVDKTLRTAAIASIANQCFTSYQQNPHLSSKTRAELMKELGSGIKQYTSRLSQSKKWHQKVGSFFGFYSKEEKELWKIISQSSKEAKKYYSLARKFGLIENAIERSLCTEMNKPMNQLKQVHMKVLEGNPLENKELQGFTQAGGIKSYLKDAIAFQKTLTPQEEELKNKFTTVISQLEFAYMISVLTVPLGESQGNMLGLTKKDFKKELIQRIEEKIQALKEDGQVGDPLIFPGGYSKETGGHAVLYHVIKTDLETCSITIINAGEGADVSFSLQGLWTFAINLGSRFLVEDITYKNVPFDALNAEFIQVLCRETFEENEKSPMKILVQQLDEVFSDKEVIKENGRKHMAQTTGSCCFKSVSSWMKGTLGEEDYNQFKLFVTERELHNLNTLQNNPIHKGVEETLNVMRTRGSAVLQKRRNKVL